MRMALAGSVIAWWLGTAGACGGGSTPATDAAVDSMDAAPPLYEGAVSGSRIKIRWYQTGDEVKSFKELFDSLRSETCAPTAFFNGTTYCAPVTADVVYADEDCKQRIGAAQHSECASEPPPTWFAERTDAACNPPVARLFRGSTEVTALAQYYRKSVGQCRRVAVTPSIQLYELSDELTTASLVAMATTTASPGEGRVVQLMYTTADGLRAPATAHDTALATNCTVTPSATDPASARCVPNNRTQALYTDDQCSEPKAEIQNGCPTDVFIELSYAPQCPSVEHAYLRLGPPATGAPLFETSRTMCTARDAESDATYFAGGPQVTLPPIARSHPDDDHRLEPIYATIDGLRTRSGLYDTMHETECVVTDVPNTGTTACLPRGAVTTRFSDDRCTTPIDVILVDLGDSGCPALPKPQFATKTLAPEAEQCRGNIELHRVGAVYLGPLFVPAPLTAEGCKMDDQPGVLAYEIGELVPLSSFVTLSTVTDP